MHEVWLPISGYEGLYEISNLGRVKALAKTVISGIRGTAIRNHSEAILTITYTNKGYCRHQLAKEGIVKIYSTHRLVAIHFIPNPNNLPEVNHIDTDKRNNQVDNLEWCTHSDNMQHAGITGRMKGKPNELHPKVKLTNQEVLEIRKLRNDGLSLKEIGLRYNVCFQHIGSIVNNLARKL